MNTTTSHQEQEARTLARMVSIKDEAPNTNGAADEQSSSPYDPPISRKLMEGICGLSTNTLLKYETEGVIHPVKAKYGALEFVT